MSTDRTAMSAPLTRRVNIVRLIVTAATATTLVASGLFPAAPAAADPAPAPKALGRPEVPKPRHDKVEQFEPKHGQADAARARRARAATEQSADAALAEQQAANESGQSMMAAAATGSATGDHTATPLSPSSTWAAGGSSGSFTWSYPLEVPAPAAGPAPDLTIGYDSGSIDGRLPSTNNQPSWLGEGFDLTSSYVERSYQPCDDDGQAGKYDQCWKFANATLVLDGKANPLIRDDADGSWRLRDDDGSQVELKTGAANGDDNGEYWQVTTTDGTRYTFGLNQLPGAAAGVRTDSAWTLPVFGDDAGEPCHDTTFATSSCTQAWKWNLDLVEDVHGNAATYWYTPEHNNYAKNGDADPGTRYTRGGWLERIDYGLRASNLFAPAPQRVSFTTAERCLATGTGCDVLTSSTKANWPDVPFAAICKDGDTCDNQPAPTFFTRRLLTEVTTKVWDAAASTHREVDSWAFAHDFLDAGEITGTEDQTLWLDSIRRTGKSGTAIALPPVTFSHKWLMNRVDKSDGILPIWKPRIYTITSDTGAVTTVTYSQDECVRHPLPGDPVVMPSSPDSNTLRCFPVMWNPNGVEDPVEDWFHKYVVTSVLSSDPTGGAQTMQTVYVYSGGTAWRYEDNPLVPTNRRTWGQWRGYNRVTTLTGDSDATRSKQVDIYLRGMNGDKQAGGPNRSVEVTGITAPPIPDSDQYAGFLRESVVYNGETSTEISGEVHRPWNRQTGSHTYPGGATDQSRIIRTDSTRERTRVTSGTDHDRMRSVTTTFDSLGMPVTQQDTGDEARSGDESCTRTWYARNTGIGLTDLVSRTQTTSVLCAATPDLPASSTSPGDVVADTATVYDSSATTWTSSQTPTRGLARWTGRAAGYTGTTASWQTVTTSTFDALGRVLTEADADAHTTTTAYTPTGAGPLTGTTVTNPKTHRTTSVIDPLRGTPTKITDPNNKVTELTYDALGRLTQVWTPISLRILGKPPTYKFGYGQSADKPSWVSTSKIRRDGLTYNTSYEFFDALLRPLQTQKPSPLGGRVIAETWYDARGLPETTMADVHDHTTAPNSTRVGTLYGGAPAQTNTSFDGAGRPTTARFLVYGTERWATTSSYTGDSVAATAPAGGTATREFTDALGRVTERRQYDGTSPNASSYTTTGFEHDKAGRLDKVTGPDGAAFTYGYDLFGRQTTSTDPDRGTTTTSYTTLDQVASTVDSRANTLLYSYDELGRKTGLWAAAKTDPNKLAAWGYDTLAKGQADHAIRYDGGVAGKAYKKATTSYDSLYRPKTQTLTLPSTDPLVTAGLPATLTFRTNYNLDGTVQSTDEPAAAGLPSELVSTSYNDLGMPIGLTGTTSYVLASSYSAIGDLQQHTLGNSTSGPQVFTTHLYEDGTRRLLTSSVTDTVHPWMPQELQYSYDDAGNVTSIHDAATLGGTRLPDFQCFSYDGHRRLSHAWTPSTADCATTGRTVANIGGAAPYWTSYAYNDAGLRTTETSHAAAGDTTSAYTYPAASAARPHSLTSRTTTPPTGTPTTASYSYDAAGNTTARPGAHTTQNLTWDAENRLKTSTEPAAGGTPAKNYTHLYDADGTLLIKRPTSGDGTTTLYTGATEIQLETTGTSTAWSGTRYYTIGGRTIAARTSTPGVTGTKLSWLIADHHATTNLTIEHGPTLTINKRATTPFGGPRGPQPAWVDDKRFLGKPDDPTTALTHIGAREYDATLGRFISVDPVLDTTDGQSLNGYAYSNNNPATFSDPTGLYSDSGGGGGGGGKRKKPPPAPDPDTGKSRNYVPTAPTPSSPASDGWIHDTNGNVMVNPHTGHPLPRPEGSFHPGGGGGDAQRDPFARFVIGSANFFFVDAVTACYRDTLSMTCGVEVVGVAFKPVKVVDNGVDIYKTVKKAGNATEPAAKGKSALANASSAAFKAADNAVGWAPKAKHVAGSPGNWSKFAEGTDPASLVQRALRSDGAVIRPDATGGRFIVETEMGGVVGTKGETWMKVVVGDDGGIITGYPVKR